MSEKRVIKAQHICVFLLLILLLHFVLYMISELKFSNDFKERRVPVIKVYTNPEGLILNIRRLFKCLLARPQKNRQMNTTTQTDSFFNMANFTGK